MRPQKFIHFGLHQNSLNACIFNAFEAFDAISLYSKMCYFTLSEMYLICVIFHAKKRLEFMLFRMGKS